MKLENQLHICKNCSNEFEGNFCNICSQQYIDKFKFTYLFKNIIDVFEFEMGYLLTLKTIYTQKNFIDSYINGKTIKYTNPIRFLFISLIIVSFVDILSSYRHDSKVNDFVSWLPDEYVLYLPFYFIFYIILYIFFKKNSSNIKITISSLYVFSIYALTEVVERLLFHFDYENITTSFMFLLIINLTYILNNNFIKFNQKIINFLFIFLIVLLFLGVARVVTDFIFEYII